MVIQRLVLLPVVWDENDLLFTKRLQMMKNVVSYSYANSIIKSMEIYTKH